MTPQEYGEALWREVERLLRIGLSPRFSAQPNAFDVNDVLSLCRRQLEPNELSPWRLVAAAQIPKEPAALRQHIAQQAEKIAEQVCAERYVEDCVHIGRFRASQNQDERKEIRNAYWVAFADWAYGDAGWRYGRRNRCGGVLGARLIAILGRREAEVHFGTAKDELDGKVFAIERFDECARAYSPQSGMKFENFLKRLICFRAGDVARAIARARFPGESPDIAVETILSPHSVAGEEKHREDEEAAHRNCLEAFRQAHKDGNLATRKIAAYELRYKAYLDPQSITPQTMGEVSVHRQQLCDEYHQCQRELRQLEDQVNEAESACGRAWEAYHTARRRLDGERCSVGELAALEREASAHNKTQLEAELAGLGAAEQQGRSAVMLQYMIAFKALAHAREKREKRWKEWVKWEECRLPWVRPQEVIAQLLAANQPMVTRHIAEVKSAMRICLGLGDEP